MKGPQNHETRPLVSIGLPVFNGSNYLRTAISGVLAQTYRNLELIVCDNASTDSTEQICRDAAASDSRVRYFRNAVNVGAAGNYNKVFTLSRGKYFKWAAHDDVLSPSFVERTVAVLEANEDAVLCSTRTSRIDEGGHVTGSYPADATWGARSASDRFRSLVFTPHACVIVFGLVRRDVLQTTPLIAPYVNSDRVLLAELGLHGRIIEIPEDLFFRRDHSGSSLRAYPDHRARVAWFDPSKSARLAFPEWRAVAGYLGAVTRAPLNTRDRMHSLGTLARLMGSQWRPLLADFKYAVFGLGAAAASKPHD